MDPSTPTKSLVAGRSVLSAGHFCEVAGMDPALLRSLVNDGKIDGLVNADGNVLGVFVEALPSTDRLRRMGAQPPADYRPDRPRSYEGDDGEEGDGADRSSREMSWPE